MKLGTRFMKISMIFVFFLIASKSEASSDGDILLSGYYVVKGISPFVAMKAADVEGAYWSLPLALPPAMVLFRRWSGDPDNVGFWRNVTVGIDLTAAGAVFIAGSAIALTSDPYIDDMKRGTVLMIGSVLFAGLSFVDLIKFSTEDKKTASLNIQPNFDYGTNLVGLNMEYYF